MVAKKYSQIHKYGGKIYKKIILIKKIRVSGRVGLGFENPNRTYILHRVLGFGFSGCSGFRVRVFRCFSVRVRSGWPGRSGFAHPYFIVWGKIA